MQASQPNRMTDHEHRIIGEALKSLLHTRREAFSITREFAPKAKAAQPSDFQIPQIEALLQNFS